MPDWPDDEIIEEFICQLNTDADGVLTVNLIEDFW